MTDFGLTESDLASAARTSMPGDAVQHSCELEHRFTTLQNPCNICSH